MSPFKSFAKYFIISKITWLFSEMFKVSKKSVTYFMNINHIARTNMYFLKRYWHGLKSLMWRREFHWEKRQFHCKDLYLNISINLFFENFEADFFSRKGNDCTNAIQRYQYVSESLQRNVLIILSIQFPEY